MFDQMPVELVLQVFSHAAHFDSMSSRAHVVNIALVSRSAYSTVAPVLYRRLVVQPQHAFFQQSDVVRILEPILHYVNNIHASDPPLTFPMFYQYSELVDGLLASWNPRPGASYTGPVQCLERFAQSNPLKCRNITRLHINPDSSTVLNLLRRLSDANGVSRCLTHVSGRMLSTYIIQNGASGARWGQRVLEYCPHLTNLRLRQPRPVLNKKPDPAKAAVVAGWLVALAKAIFEVARPTRMECFVVYFAGWFATDVQSRSELLAVLKIVNDPRLIIAFDDGEEEEDVWSDWDTWERYVRTEHWNAEGQLRVEDAAA